MQSAYQNGDQSDFETNGLAAFELARNLSFPLGVDETNGF
jgi:hypothetical protein